MEIHFPGKRVTWYKFEVKIWLDEACTEPFKMPPHWNPFVNSSESHLDMHIESLMGCGPELTYWYTWELLEENVTAPPFLTMS